MITKNRVLSNEDIIGYTKGMLDLPISEYFTPKIELFLTFG